jgi:hypothetical protein
MSIESIAICLHHSKAAKTEKLVLLGIANHDGDGGAWPSVATLARYANCSERHVQRAIQSLVELGEIQVVDQAGGNEETRRDRRPNLYKVLVRCPVDCDGTSQHRTRGDADGTPSNGATESDSRGDISGTNGVTPVSPEPSLEPSSKPIAAAPRESAKKDELFEAVAVACGIDWTTITASGRGPLNRAVKELKEIGVTADQVGGRAAAYKKQYPDAALTPMALTKHWASLAPAKTAARKSIWETYDPPESYYS